MEIDITEIVVSFIGMLSLIVTGVITPILKKWIKSKVTNEQWQTILDYAYGGVQAAEILIAK